MRDNLKYLAVSVLLFGGIWPVSKDALRDATPLWFALNRAGLAAIVATLLLLAMRRLAWPGRRDWPAVLGIGALQLGGFFALMHLALGIMPAGRSAILGNVTVFWLVPLSVWLLHEKVSPRRWLSAAVGLAGVGVLMAPWSWGDNPGEMLGYALLLGASLCWSIAIVITRAFPPQRTVLELLPFCFGLGALLLAPLALWREPTGGIGAGALWQALFVGGFAAPVGTWATIEAGRRLPGMVVAVGFLLVPALGVVLANLWLGEALGLDVFLGGALIVVSVLLAVKG